MWNAKMKMPKETYESIKEDIKVVIEKAKLDFVNLDHGHTGNKCMWGLLSIVSAHRAYDDNHPRFKGPFGLTRYLDYDGRDYCWYYNIGLNDNHIATALSSIKLDLLFECCAK